MNQFQATLSPLDDSGLSSEKNIMPASGCVVIGRGSVSEDVDPSQFYSVGSVPDKQISHKHVGFVPHCPLIATVFYSV